MASPSSSTSSVTSLSLPFRLPLVRPASETPSPERSDLRPDNPIFSDGASPLPLPDGLDDMASLPSSTPSVLADDDHSLLPDFDSSTTFLPPSETIHQSTTLLDPPISQPIINLSDNDDELDGTGDDSAENKTKRRLRFTPDMTAKIMELFLACRREGLFNVIKKSLLRNAWKRVLEDCILLWPAFEWSEKSIQTKYETERTRYRLWQTLTSQSGFTYNDDTGLPEAGEEKWHDFMARNQGKRGIEWLRTTPLGHVSTYQEVFFKDVASGRNIADVDEILTTLSTPHRRLPPTASSSSSSLSQRPKRSQIDLTDPINSPDLPAGLANRPYAYPPIKRQRQASEKEGLTDQGLLLVSEQISKAAAAFARPRPVGSDDVSLAIPDLLKRFPLLTGEEVKTCLDKLEKPMTAVVWNVLGDNQVVKEQYVKAWLEK